MLPLIGIARDEPVSNVCDRTCLPTVLECVLQVNGRRNVGVRRGIGESTGIRERPGDRVSIDRREREHVWPGSVANVVVNGLRGCR